MLLCALCPFSLARSFSQADLSTSSSAASTPPLRCTTLCDALLVFSSFTPPTAPLGLRPPPDQPRAKGRGGGLGTQRQKGDFSVCWPWNERKMAIGGVCRWLLVGFRSTRHSTKKNPKKSSGESGLVFCRWRHT